jgi:hypothetical protein
METVEILATPRPIVKFKIIPVSIPIQWRVEGDIGSIVADGTFMASHAGKGTVVATSGDATASVPVIPG